MSTKNRCEFLFVKNYKLFFNWSGCVSALRDTKQMLEKHMESETKGDLLQNWSPEEINHIKDFVRHNRVYNEEEQKMTTLRCSCDLCQKVYSRIQVLLVGPGKVIPFEIKETLEASEPWWILLKMNLPVSNDTSMKTTNIRNCDIKWMCKILQRCSLFAGHNDAELSEIIRMRNALIHSGSNELSDEIKEQYILSMQTFLRNNRIDGSENLDKYRRPNVSRFSNRLEECTELQGALSAQLKSIENDIKELQKKGMDTVDLNVVKKIVMKSESVVRDKRKLEEREVTLYEAVRKGANEGSNSLGGGIIAQHVGGLLGASGALVAGRLRQFVDKDN